MPLLCTAGPLLAPSASRLVACAVRLVTSHRRPALLSLCSPLLARLQIIKEDDASWPAPDQVGRQELEVVLGNEHISFATTKLGSLLQVQSSDDPEGLRVFYYLVQDLKCLVFSLISAHFKIQPIAR